MHEQFAPPENCLLTFAYTYHDEADQLAVAKKADPDIYPSTAWERLQECNKIYGAELFEGLVAKRNNSVYPLQRRNSEEAFTGWMKHRWTY